ncbi:MAG: glycosyltransferase family 4 protein [Myxococcota bacterium]
MLRPLKIVHVCRIGWPHMGGMESVVGGLAGSLADAGHDVRVVTLDRAITNGERLPRGIWGGVRYTRLRRVGPRRYPAALHLTSALKGADVVHVHGVDGLLHQALAGRPLHGAKVGLTPHGAFLHTRRNYLIKQGWLRTGAAVALRGADRVWFTSEAERQTLSPAGIEGPVLTNGVDVESFSSIRRRPESGRWLVMGRVDVHKGLDDLLVRLAALAQHDPRPFQLRVVGPETAAGLVARLQAQAQRLGIRHRVQFLGPVSDGELRAELARCELALFPSRYEGFGVAVVEAMAAGVPVVVNDIPPFRELVRDGETGFIVPFAKGSGRRMIYEIRDKAQVVSGPARAAATRHSWTARVREWVQVYADLVAS